MFQRDFENWYKFNFAKGCKAPDENGVHFFLHDYQFQRLWDMPERYMLMLRRFDCVFTPDFSLYADMPKAMQIYHHYKKQWLGAYWQANCITVVPTVSWSDQASFEWCFDGIPPQAAVAVSSVGCMKDSTSLKLFLNGYQEMLKRLQPNQILFYGTVPEQIDKKSVIHIMSFQEKFKKEVDLWAAEVEVVEKNQCPVV